jgi:hypothetical protein
MHSFPLIFLWFIYQNITRRTILLNTRRSSVQYCLACHGLDSGTCWKIPHKYCLELVIRCSDFIYSNGSDDNISVSKPVCLDSRVRRVWRYQRVNQNPYIKEEQTTQWFQIQTVRFRIQDLVWTQRVLI